MTYLAAQLQAIQATASEDGTISAAALNDVINALNSVSAGIDILFPTVGMTAWTVLT